MGRFFLFAAVFSHTALWVIYLKLSFGVFQWKKAVKLMHECPFLFPLKTVLKRWTISSNLQICPKLLNFCICCPVILSESNPITKLAPVFPCSWFNGNHVPIFSTLRGDPGIVDLFVGTWREISLINCQASRWKWVKFVFSHLILHGK